MLEELQRRNYIRERVALFEIGWNCRDRIYRANVTVVGIETEGRKDGLPFHW